MVHMVQGWSYLQGRWVGNCVRQVIKVVNGLVDGIVVQVEIAERVYNTDMPTKQATHEITRDVGRQPHATTDFRKKSTEHDTQTKSQQKQQIIIIISLARPAGVVAPSTGSGRWQCPMPRQQRLQHQSPLDEPRYALGHPGRRFQHGLLSGRRPVRVSTAKLPTVEPADLVPPLVAGEHVQRLPCVVWR